MAAEKKNATQAEDVKEEVRVEPEEKATAKKTTTRKTATKKAEEKAEAVKAEEEKKTPAKKTATKKTTTKKTTTKKTATKTAAKTTAKKAEEENKPARRTTTRKISKNVFVEFYGVHTKISVEDYESRIKDIWVKEWNRPAKDLKSIDLYIKPEDGKVYFVINGNEHGAINL